MTSSRTPHVLVVRLDNEGDVLLAGPAVRAVSASADHVTLLCGPRGRQAAELLVGVDAVHVYRAAWIDPDPTPVDSHATSELVRVVASWGVDQAIVLTSFHQSPLPTALLLRLAGVPFVAAISEDYPGSLLDVRHHVPDTVHEVERALSLARTLGYELPAGDDGLLRVHRPERGRYRPPVSRRYVVLHPGASVSARAWAPERYRAVARALADLGWDVVVTGSGAERQLCEDVLATTEAHGVNLAGETSFGQLAEVLASADAIVVGNTGPAHLAAAVGTPVVSLFAPTVPLERWRPYRVPQAVLNVSVPCAGCRARSCPVAGHPCLSGVEPTAVVEGVRRLAEGRDATRVAPDAPAPARDAAGEPTGRWSPDPAGRLRGALSP